MAHGDARNQLFSLCVDNTKLITFLADHVKLPPIRRNRQFSGRQITGANIGVLRECESRGKNDE
jgi:hypothetical protein